MSKQGPELAFEKVEAVLDQVLDLPAEQRPAALDRLCADDASLRQEAERLLAADAAASGIESISMVSSSGNLPAPGDRLGAWRLGQMIGVGGMGIVFRAERDDGYFQQRAALKLVRNRLEPELMRRFHLERETVARLQHPQVARILDGGVDGEGRAFMVMEYVDGVPIDDYCRARKASVAERLRLVLQICEGVSHAHRRLVVHRDLKPANVLVDADGQVKLLDFGIAKLMDEGQQQDTLTGAALMTPGYAAPEQVLGGEISVATDVYGLGALIYRLLTGQSPLPGDSLPLPELLRQIREHEPLAPSQVSASEPQAPDFSIDRELDLIVLMALRKDPAQRYASVDALAADLRRYLNKQPVSAVPPSRRYRLAKFLRRNALAVLVTGAVLVSLVGALGVALWQAEVARAERDESQRQAEIAGQALEFLVDVFRVEVRQNIEPEDITALDLLEQGVARIDSSTELAPEVRAPLLEALGSAFRNLAQFEVGIDLLRQAVQVAEQHRGMDPFERIRYHRVLAFALMSQGDYDAAEQALGAVLAQPDWPGQAVHYQVASVYQTDGLIAHFQGDYEKSVMRHRQSIDLYQQLDAREDAASARLGLGNSLFQMGDAQASIRETRAAVAELEALPERPVRALSRGYNDLALRSFGIGDLVGAEAAFEALSAPAAQRSDDELTTGMALYMANHAGIATDLGLLDKAQRLSSRSLKRREELLDPDSGYLMSGRMIQGMVDLERGVFSGADQQFSRVLEVLERQDRTFSERGVSVAALAAQARMQAGQAVSRQELAELLPRARANPGILSRSLGFVLQALVEHFLLFPDDRWRIAAGELAEELKALTAEYWPDEAWRKHWAAALQLVVDTSADSDPAIARQQLDQHIAGLPQDSWRRAWIRDRLQVALQP